MGNYQIAIDAGHGSDTPGKRTPPFTKDVDINGNGNIDVKKGEQYKEHYANIGVANLLYQELSNRGYDLTKSGWVDSNPTNHPDIPLSQRQSIIRNEACDYTISIHFNAFGDGKSFNSAEGIEIYIHSLYPNDSRRMAQYVLNELIKGTPQRNRGIKSSRLALCNCQTMNTKASILIELAFMTNAREAMELMANSGYWKESAVEIADAIDKFCNCNNEEITDSDDDMIKLYHTVVAGETLSQIALENNTTVDQLVQLNNIDNPNLIRVGQRILLIEYTYYTVKRGDTLSAISQKFLGDANRYGEIMELNNLTGTRIYINQVLKIPRR